MRKQEPFRGRDMFGDDVVVYRSGVDEIVLACSGDAREMQTVSLDAESARRLAEWILRAQGVPHDAT